MKKNKLISIFKKSELPSQRSGINYITKTSALNYVKYSTQQIINGSIPGSLPNVREGIDTFITSEDSYLLTSENNNNLITE